MDEKEARDALAGIGSAQARLARTTAYPAWRHAAFGGVMAVFVGGLALPTALNLVATTIGLVGTVILAQSDRERMGLFINGYRKGATRWVTLGLIVVVLALAMAQVRLRFGGGPDVAKLAVVALAFALAWGASVLWWRVYVRELTGGAR